MEREEKENQEPDQDATLPGTESLAFPETAGNNDIPATQKQVREGCGLEKVEEKEMALGSGDSASDLSEVLTCSEEGRAIGEALDNMSVLQEGKDFETLKADTMKGETLSTAKGLADREQGYRWKEGLLLRFKTDELGERWGILVLSQSFRQRVLTLAHEKSGHFSRKKVLTIIQRSFTWPGIVKDVQHHCRSCSQCQTTNKSGPPKAVTREIITEPFERVCVDLVGPLPKARGGYQYLLTPVCVETRWPEAVPLRSM